LNETTTTNFLLGRYTLHRPASLEITKYDPTFALAQAALKARLGAPLTNEHIAMFQGSELVYQFYAGGLAWCVPGKWDEVHIARW